LWALTQDFDQLEKRIEKSFDCLFEIVPGKDTLRIKLQIVRIWEVPTFLKPDQTKTNSLEMVLIDKKVN